MATVPELALIKDNSWELLPHLNSQVPVRNGGSVNISHDKDLVVIVKCTACLPVLRLIVLVMPIVFPNLEGLAALSISP